MADEALPEHPTRFRSCTGSPANGSFSNRRCRGCRAMAIHARSGSVTRHDQLQLDVFGEAADAMAQALRAGYRRTRRSQAIRNVILPFLEQAWRQLMRASGR